MASGSTNIDDLPTSDKPNVTMEMQEQPVQPQVNVNAPSMAQLSQEDINKIVSGIQTASQQNLTSLPSRDIPMDTQQIATDTKVQPNYVPKDQNDYINNYDNAQQVYNKQMEKEKNKIKQDELYDELQTPLLISILFLLFHLPFVNKNLFRYLPSLFVKDGTLSFGGHLFKSGIFGVVYFVIMRLINYMSDI